jgi:hypothetical protein
LNTVLLKHSLPDGTVHWDWLLERESGEARVMTFRVHQPWPVMAGPIARPWHAEALEDHRTVYLQYEGPVSGNRGHVERAASGAVLWHGLDRRSIDLEVRWQVIHPHAGVAMDARSVGPWTRRFVGHLRPQESHHPLAPPRPGPDVAVWVFDHHSDERSTG